MIYPSKHELGRRQAAVFALLAWTCCTIGGSARAIEANWDAPQLDTWLYNNNSFTPAGLRQTAPSYRNALTLNAAQTRFQPLTLQDPARLASMMMAFDTSLEITAGQPAANYQVESVTVTVTMYEAIGSIFYEPLPETRADLIAAAINQTEDNAHPMEMYGVGFRGGYDGFSFDGSGGPSKFTESVNPVPTSGYIPYPIDANSSGQYRDVANSVSGGFSALPAAANAAPFDANPWAIGTTSLSPGEVVPNGTTFTFALNLGAPGVLEYVQNSLATGALGVFLTSMHTASQPGVGGEVSYPRWATKESVNHPDYMSVAPTLEVIYSLADDQTSGDYDADGDVDGADFLEWQRDLGTNVAPHGSGSDGDGSGLVDAGDLDVWRDNFGTTPGELAASSIPEPAAGLLACCGLAVTIGACRRERQ